MAKEKKNTHGGKRHGSGRKVGSTHIDPDDLRKTFGTRLPQHQIDWLKKYADENGMPCSILLENIIRFYQASL